MSEGEKAQRQPRQRGVWALGVVVLIGAGVGVYWYWNHNQHRVIYEETKVIRGDIRTTILSTGSVAPENRLDLKPPVAGRVEKVIVQEGDHVRSGQVLAWLSSSERAALIDAAKSKSAEELKYWEDAYKMTPILAPKAGLIILKNADSGQSVTATDIVLSMSDRLIVKANVDETDLAQIKLGESAEIILDAFSKQPLKAKVEHIGYDAKTINNVTTYEVDVATLETPEFMKSGMTANVSFVLDERKDVLLVPAASMKRENHKSFVMVPDPDHTNKPKKLEIRTGLNDGKKVEVLDGLKEGDTVLMANLQSLRASGGDKATSAFGGPPGSGGGGRR